MKRTIKAAIAAALCVCTASAASCSQGTPVNTTAGTSAAAFAAASDPAEAVTVGKETNEMTTSQTTSQTGEQTTASSAGTTAAEAVTGESGETINTDMPLWFCVGIWQTVGNAPYETYYYFGSDGTGETRMQQDGKRRNFKYRFENGKLIIRSDGNTNDIVAEVTEKGAGELFLDWDLVQSQTVKYLGGFDFNWFTFYTTEEIRKLATGYFMSRNGFEPEKVEAYIDQDEMIRVDITEHVYSSTYDDVPGCDLTYIIDRFTAKGTMIGDYGEDIPIDLLDMSYPETITPAEWSPTVTQRQSVLDNNRQIGAMFLGTTDGSKDLNALLKSSGAADMFDFLSGLPADRYVETPLGQEVYLVIPLDRNAKVTVTELLYDDETFSDIPDETIYSSADGAPFIIRCNATGRRADVSVTVLDSSGNIYEWTPALFIGGNGDKTLCGTDDVVYDLSALRG